VRGIGPVDGVKTAKASSGGAPAAQAADGEQIAKANGCTACHATANKLVGPSFRDIGSKYAKVADADATLATRIRQGGTGNWGQIPMPPQPQVKDGDLKAMVQWILAGAK
jgi:cytochrome c